MRAPLDRATWATVLSIAALLAGCIGDEPGHGTHVTIVIEPIPHVEGRAPAVLTEDDLASFRPEISNALRNATMNDRTEYLTTTTGTWEEWASQLSGLSLERGSEPNYLQLGGRTVSISTMSQ